MNLCQEPIICGFSFGWLSHKIGGRLLQKSWDYYKKKELFRPVRGTGFLEITFPSLNSIQN